MQSLVNKVPDEAALEVGIFAYQVPVFLKSAAGVAHHVCVFALNERLCLRCVLCITLASGLRHVHRAVNVGVVAAVCLLELDWTACVLRLYPLVCGGEVVAVDGLVAERPGDDARMVEECLDVALVALHYLLCEHRLLCRCVVAVAEAVAFDVCLGANVYSVLVAKVVPFRVVGIMACANGVDIEPLHYADVLYHALPGHYIAQVGVHFMTVCTLYVDMLSVYKQCSVLYFNLAETNLYGYYFDDTASLLHRCGKGVQIRGLGRPLHRALYAYHGILFPVAVKRARAGFIAVFVSQR